MTHLGVVFLKMIALMLIVLLELLVRANLIVFEIEEYLELPGLRAHYLGHILLESGVSLQLPQVLQHLLPQLPQLLILGAPAVAIMHTFLAVFLALIDLGLLRPSVIV